jgi:hypothetical protein
MTTPKTIDRKTFLTTAAAALSAVTLGACSDEGDGGGTDDGTGGTATGGTATGGTATGGTATGGTATGGAAGSGTGGSATGGAAGSATGGTAGSGGMGGGYICTTETSNGDHAHPLTIPSSDVERGYQEGPYTLQDGGTGHTHTVELTAYEFLYLSGGMMVTTESSTDAGHLHSCVITCAPG